MKTETSQTEVLAQLLRLAGTRPEVPDEVRTRVKSVVHQHWKNSVRGKGAQRKWWLASGTAAAAVFLYFVLMQFIALSIPSGSSLGIVENINSEVLVTSAENRRGIFLSKADILESETWIETTKSGRILLYMIGGARIRMDIGTRLRLDSESEFVLERGTVYVDSGIRRVSLKLSTPAGILRNDGTQFEARMHEGTLRVRVREGRVSLQRKEGARSVTAGTEMSVNPEGSYRFDTVAGYGPQWKWLSEVAPGFQLEGRTLTEFLNWLQRETGWNYEFVDRNLARNASQIVLHGSVDGLEPEQMPSAVLPVCGLEYTLHRGILKITGTAGELR